MENPFKVAEGIDPVDLGNAPSVSLGGITFHVPRLAIAQNRIVVGCFKKLLPMIGQIEAMAAREKAEKGALSSMILQNFPIDDETFPVLSMAVYAALTRGYVITQKEFENLPIGVDELIMAVPLVLMQSFAFVKKGGTPAAPAGEAQATPTMISATMPLGTESPSESAALSAGPGTTSNAA